jgi:hypothetical protein
MAHDYKLVYVLGSGHCGSTLLDMILNGHQQIVGLGEVIGLPKLINEGKPPENKALLDTPFWRDVTHRFEKTSSIPLKHFDSTHPPWHAILSWGAENIAKWANPNKLFFSCIQQVSGARVLTDASKTPHRLYLLAHSGLFDIKVIHLIRDGRAVMNSYSRKRDRFRLGLRMWAPQALSGLYLPRNLPNQDWLRIRYEELATQPEEMLKTICAFLGVSFEPQMLAYRSQPYFGIPGNRMVYLENEDIVLDEVWKKDLKSKHRLGFTLIAGWLNRLYGYGVF